MLELPGMTTSGDAGLDVQKILRYLSKLVPQIEMELMNAQQDDYQGQMAAQSQGVGAVDKNSTAGALAAHELRKDNPHQVTAAQLGLTLDKAVKLTLADGGLVARIGEKKGLQINVQQVKLTVSSWTQHGGVAYADTALGAWKEKIPVLYDVKVTVDGSTAMGVWAGPLKLSTSEQIGTMRIYRECDISTGEGASNNGTLDRAEDERNITMKVMGVGVFGYGEQ